MAASFLANSVVISLLCHDDMQEDDRRPNLGSSGLGRYWHAPAFAFAPDQYRMLDEAASWVEFDSKTRSVRYHVGKYVEYGRRDKDTEDVVSGYDHAAEAYAPQNERLIRYDDESMSSNGWRQKAEYDMAISGLLALKNILELLYENGKRMVNIARSLTIWSFSMSASYEIRRLHYHPYLDRAALATFCVASYYTMSSTCQLFHVGMRTLAIKRCQCIVTSLHTRLLAGTVDQNDVDSLYHCWFRALRWYKVEDRRWMQQFETLYGSYVPQRSLSHSDEYVIPED